MLISDFSHNNSSTTSAAATNNSSRGGGDALHHDRIQPNQGQVHQPMVAPIDLGSDDMPLRSKPVSPVRGRGGGNFLLVDNNDEPEVEEMSKVADSPNSSPSAPEARTRSETKAQEDNSLSTILRLQQTKPWHNAHNLARSIWLRSERERRTQIESTSLSATLLYNLGLNFHLCAAGEDKAAAERKAGHRQDSEGDAKRIVLYDRALMFYKMSSEIMQRTSMATMAVECPILIVALHNMTLIYTILENHEMATEVRCKLVHLLRSMETSAVSRQYQRSQGQLPREKGYEKLLLRLLTLPKDSTVAAAA